MSSFANLDLHNEKICIIYNIIISINQSITERLTYQHDRAQRRIIILLAHKQYDVLLSDHIFII